MSQVSAHAWEEDRRRGRGRTYGQCCGATRSRGRPRSPRGRFEAGARPSRWRRRRHGRCSAVWLGSQLACLAERVRLMESAGEWLLRVAIEPDGDLCVRCGHCGSTFVWPVPVRGTKIGRCRSSLTRFGAETRRPRCEAVHSMRRCGAARICTLHVLHDLQGPPLKQTD